MPAPNRIRAEFLVAASLLVWCVPAAAQVEGPVVDVDWLSQALSGTGLVVLQVSDAEQFAEGHIPGAQRVEMADFAAPRVQASQVPQLVLELPTVERLRSTLERLGISDDSWVAVVPTARTVTQAARIVLTLDVAGLGAQAVYVDGGLEAWKSRGLPLTSAPTSVERGRFGLTMQDRLVSADWVMEGNATRTGFSLLDGRTAPFYEGDRADRGKRGHIRGARSMPAPELLEEDPETGVVRLKSVDEVRELFEAAGVEDHDTVVAYCHIGQYASMVLLNARRLGHEALLFDGSMNQWAVEDRPVVVEGGAGPGD